MLGGQKSKLECRILGLALAVMVVGILVGVGLHFARQSPYSSKIGGEKVEPGEAGVRFGDVLVDPVAGEIRIIAEVRQNLGWVRFLVYLDSYKWLREEAAIVSLANLADLQMAIALLDWRLWDGLWHRETTGQEVEVSLKWHWGEIEANEVVQLPERLGIGDLIFLGSPLFDPLFLDRCLQTIVCVALSQRPQCPLFSLQETIEAKFVRANGGGGFSVEGLPPPGTRVTVIIRVPAPPEV